MLFDSSSIDKWGTILEGEINDKLYNAKEENTAISESKRIKEGISINQLTFRIPEKTANPSFTRSRKYLEKGKR